jgi:hypothetical protein
MNPSGDPNHSGAAIAGPCGDEFLRDDRFVRHPTPTTGSLDGVASYYVRSLFCWMRHGIDEITGLNRTVAAEW